MSTESTETHAPAPSRGEVVMAALEVYMAGFAVVSAFWRGVELVMAYRASRQPLPPVPVEDDLVDVEVAPGIDQVNVTGAADDEEATG